MAESWDYSVDVLVIGSGNGGLTAALCSYEMGRPDVLVVEKGARYGGTSSVSGGGGWVPCNRSAREAGAADSTAAAREYLQHTIPDGSVPQEMIAADRASGPRRV